MDNWTDWGEESPAQWIDWAEPLPEYSGFVDSGASRGVGIDLGDWRADNIPEWDRTPLPPDAGDVVGAGDSPILAPSVMLPQSPGVEQLPDGSFVIRSRGQPGMQGPTPPSEDAAFSRSVDRLVELGTAAIRLNQAYRQAGAPSVRASGASGAYATVARRDGYLYVTTPAGSTRRLPAPGQPYLTEDGATIVNNGNGTFDLIAPGVPLQRLAYPGGATGGGSGMLAGANVSPWLLAALGLGAVALWRGGQRHNRT